MGIARYRDAETGELIPGPTKDREYVVERPIGSDWGGDPIWPDEAPVHITVDQETAKQLRKILEQKEGMKEVVDSIDRQIWKYDRNNYV